jgi:hypothetical protein
MRSYVFKSCCFDFSLSYCFFLLVLISTRYDPLHMHATGALHYLLGHKNPIDGKFRIRADGKEKELFTDYGIHYEPVRKRKGYSKI